MPPPPDPQLLIAEALIELAQQLSMLRVEIHAIHMLLVNQGHARSPGRLPKRPGSGGL
jgi:hypothetical protein